MKMISMLKTNPWTWKAHPLLLVASLAVIVLQAGPAAAAGQAPPQTPGVAQQTPADPNAPQPRRDFESDSIRPNYVLGPNDQILIRAPGADEINEKPFRIDAEGYVNLPLVGRVRAAGMTVQQLEADLAKRLSE